MITYANSLKDVQVKIDGKVTGRIIRVKGGFAYHPKGTPKKFRGHTFPTVDQVKQSLEQE